MKKLLEVAHALGGAAGPDALDQATASELFQHILQNMSEGLAVVVGERIAVCNRAFCALCGQDVADLEGATLESLCDGVDLAASKPGTSRVMDTTFRGTCDAAVPVELSVTELQRKNEAAPRTFLCLFKDVRGQRQAEYKLKELYAQLVRASKDAGLAEMASHVLHNVGNVLNSVTISAGLIRSKADGIRTPALERLAKQLAAGAPAWAKDDPKLAKVPRFLSEMASSLEASRAALQHEAEALCKHVHHITRVVQAQQRTAVSGSSKEPLVLQSLVDTALTLIDSPTESETLTWQCAIDVNDRIFVDEHKLLQIMVNLLTNAKHATAAVSSTENVVSVRARTVGEDIEIAVIDQGAGIPPEVLPRIFEHGFTTKPSGSGFGLHASRLAAQDMGGSLTAHSAGEGQGATFTLRLPAGAPKKSQREPELVLVVDDEAAVARTVARGLREAGFRTVVADGHSAMAAFEAKQPQYVITDLMMEGATGLEIIRHLVAQDFHRIIAMSGGASTWSVGQLEEVRQAGAQALIHKPMLTAELVTALLQLRATAG